MSAGEATDNDAKVLGDLENHALGYGARFTRRENDWVLDIGEHLSICIEASWRLRTTEHILATDADDGHQFGLPAPVDAERSANDALRNLTVSSLRCDLGTADLQIGFSNELTIDVWTNSLGYESWQAYVRKELFAVGGNGGLR